MRNFIIGVLVAAATAPHSSAAFVGVTVELVDAQAEGWTSQGYDDNALDTYRIYATFDGPSLVASVGDAEVGPSFRLESGNGTFVNAPAFDSMLPPDPALVAGSPSLAWDTFVTIGALAEPTPVTKLTAGFAAQAQGIEGDFFLNDEAWFVEGTPDQAMTDVLDRVLVAQVTVDEGIAIIGTNWSVFGITDGVTFVRTVDRFSSTMLPPCPADVNGDGAVGFADLTNLLNAWGPCPGCAADVTDDGTVGFADLTFLLNAWGPCSDT